MYKILTLIKLIIKSKIVVNLKETDLIIYDKKSLNSLENFFSKYKFFLLENRIEDIEKIYINFNILIYVLKNFFKRKLYSLYFEAVILDVKPKVVLNLVDNSIHFSQISKILENKILFLTIQNSSRYEYLHFDYLLKKKLVREDVNKKYYFSNFFGFAECEREMFKKLGIKFKNYFSVGDIRWSAFIKTNKKENSLKEIKYASDICLISDYVTPGSSWHSYNGYNLKTKKKLLSHNKSENDSLKYCLLQIVNFTLKLCLEKNYKLKIPLKRDHLIDPKGSLNEIEFFKENLSKEYYDFFCKSIIQKSRADYTSFKSIRNSKLVIGFASTLLKNKIADNGKILSCNFSKLSVYDFPIKGICSLNECDYNHFKKRVEEILSIDYQDYLKNLSLPPDYVMSSDQNSALDSLEKFLYKKNIFKIEN